jgi:hypothetical protein
MVALSGGESLWTLEAQLLAQIADLLAGANWQRSGGKSQKPKPIKRPGVTGDEQTFGSARSREEIDALLAMHVGERRTRGGG